MKRLAVPLAILLAGAIGVARLQPKLAETLHSTKMKEDVYVLPPPAQLKLMTLGYHSAAVDHLWAKTLIEFGTHAVEKRDFDYAPNYVDAMIELEPDFQTLYKYVDTLMVYRRNGPGTADDARLARKYLERGTRERPYDHDVWLQYGQFIAFMASSFLKDPKEIEQWRHDGALAIGRAVELGASVDRGLSAAGILSKAGDTDAAIRQLQRQLALTDDPDKRDEIAARLRQLQQTQEDDRIARDMRLLDAQWRGSFPFLSRGEFLLIGPERSTAACAGPSSASEPACTRSWDARLESLH
jgi:tetratricopeptide (TPR) repeat protein